MTDRQGIVVVGQIPPPFHGQSIMIERLISTKMQDIDLHHVGMSFSKSNDEVGKPGFRKFFHLFSVIFRIMISRWRTKSSVLYYPPAGPNKVPMLRDCLILISTRWMFRKTIFHMQASGISTLYSDLNLIGQWFYRRAYYYPDAMIRLSELTIDDATALCAKQEFIVPNCADDEKQRFPVSRPEALENSIGLLYVGTVCQGKGILTLLNACHIAQTTGIDFHLHVVGDYQPASFKDDVASAITRLGLTKRVTLHGQLTGDAKHLRFAQADIFCFPSFYKSEAFPCVIVEAMSFGLPVISTYWRGIPSIVDHEKTGFLTPIQDENATAEYIRILSKPAVRAELGSAGRSRYLQHFTTEIHQRTMEAVFNEFCDP